MQPVFVSYGTQLVGEPQLVGNGNHIKFKVRHKSRVFDCIGFNLADQYAKLNTTRSNLGIAYHIEENVWNDRVTIQLRIKGIK
jgi:single-stranded-DNA-specific exonuclease